MEQVHRFIQRFSVFELVLAALMAALGIASKPMVGTLAKALTGPLSLPGGTVVGGIYMIWIVAACVWVGKGGTALLVGLLQAAIATMTGMGSHGAMNLLSYGMPVLLMELVFVIMRDYARKKSSAALGAAVANASGVVLTAFLFFRIPLPALLIGALVGAISGALGGLAGRRLALGLKPVFS
jgi:energy-coupling factor transport system substrate-specific component